MTSLLYGMMIMVLMSDNRRSVSAKESSDFVLCGSYHLAVASRSQFSVHRSQYRVYPAASNATRGSRLSTQGQGTGQGNAPGSSLPNNCTE